MKLPVLVVLKRKELNSGRVRCLPPTARCLPPTRSALASPMSYRPPHLRGSQRGPPAAARPATAPPRGAAAAAASGFTPSGASLQQRLSQRSAAAAACVPPAEAAAADGTGFGTCMRMCCEREWRERERFRELSRLEYAAGSTEHDSRPKCDPELAVRRLGLGSANANANPNLNR